MCVSFTTIDLNLQLLRSSHCVCSSSHPALASLPVQCSPVCFMFLHMYLVKQNHSWTRWSHWAPVSCAVTVHDMKGLQGREVLEPFLNNFCWFSVNQHIKLGWWCFSYEYLQKDYCTSELLIHCLFLGARPVREECCRNILFASVLKCQSRFVHDVELRVCMRQLAVLGERWQKSPPHWSAQRLQLCELKQGSFFYLLL